MFQFQRKASDPGPHRIGPVSGRTSSSSLASIGSMSSSGSSSHHSSHLPSTVEVSESARHGYSVDVPVNEDVSRGTGLRASEPAVPKRTSSRNIVLSNLQTLDSQSVRSGSGASGSMESIAKSSDSSHSRRSHDSSGSHTARPRVHGQQDICAKQEIQEESVVPEMTSEAERAPPPYHSSRRLQTGSPTHHGYISSKAPSKHVESLYTQPGGPQRSLASSSINQSETHGMRVPLSGTSSAAFITASSTAVPSSAVSYHQPHRISGAYPAQQGPTSPPPIPPQPQSYPPGSIQSQRELFFSGGQEGQYLSHPMDNNGGRGSPASSVHSWPDTQRSRHYNHDHRYAQDSRLQTVDDSRWRTPDQSRPGPSFTVRFHDRKGLGGTTIEMPQDSRSQHLYRSPHSNVSITTSRSPAPLAGYPPHVNLVTERLKK